MQIIILSCVTIFLFISETHFGDVCLNVIQCLIKPLSALIPMWSLLFPYTHFLLYLFSEKLELGVIAGGGSSVGYMCFLLDFDAKCVNDTGVFN